MPPDGAPPPASGAPPTPFRLTSLIGPVYAPTVLYAIGQGIAIPVVPLFAKELGAGLGLVGLIVAVRGIGSMLFDVPAGLLVSRFGGRSTMAAGTAGTALAAVGVAFSTNAWQLAALMLLTGASMSVWQVSRLTYIAEAAPAASRGRAIALAGGSNRIGVFIGPFLGGFVGSAFGLASVFFVQAAVVAAGALFVLWRTPAGVAAPATSRDGHAHARIGRTLVEYRRSFLTVGLVALALVLMRQARQVIMPLWGDEIGLDVAEIGVVIGLASAADMVLFYPVGVVMDRYGRKFAVVPSLITLGTGMILIPVADSFVPFLLAGLLTGFGNGLGSGVVMTLGADLAPRDRAGEFLGVWRLISDSGAAAAPIAVGAAAEVLTLGIASVATGGLGLAAAVVMVLFVSETLGREPIVPTEAQPPPEGSPP
ncbi:MAG: MFS transporter [Dehalococcoidia bacterium]